MSCSCSYVERAPGRARANRRRRGARGLTLIELMVAQVVAAIVIAGMFSLVAAQTKSFHANWSANEAQVRLREATHVVLRELQGLGGEEGSAGDVVAFIDGGAGDSDYLTVFMRDHSICSGLVTGGRVSGDSVVVQLDADEDLSDPPDGTNDCPIDTLPGCAEADLTNRTLLVRGDGDRGAFLTATTANASSCQLTFDSGALNAPNVTAYDLRWADGAGSFSTVDDVLDDLGTDVTSVIMGSTMTFYVDTTREVLTRSVNGGAFVDVLPQVHDLQVMFAHDIDGDGVIGAGEWDQTGTLAGATPMNFFGVKFGFLTFAGAADGIEAPPATLANRSYASAPTGRRYRYSTHFAAARNR